MNPALMPYLAAVNAQLGEPEPRADGGPMVPLDLGAMAFGNAAPPPTAPIMLGGRPIAAPPMDPVPSGPLASMPQPLMSSASTPPPPPAPAGPPPPPNVNAAPPADAGPVDPHPFPLTLVGGGGVTPAKEVDMRGPSLRAAQASANDAFDVANQMRTARTEDTAQREYEMYLAQERQAQARQAAAQQAAAERDEELQQRAQDFDQSVKALSKMSLDPNRFWASRTTGQKISAMVGIALGGFVQGARGGSNAGLDIINQQIERDIKAQEFAYSATRDAANAKQTAFGMAMQKYGSVDAARSMARASALDAVQAQIAQNAALWKGTQAANHGDAMMAELENQKMQQIAQGVKFLPATATGPVFRDPRTGVIYTNKDAQGLAEKWQAQEYEREKIGLNTAGKLLEEGVKSQGKSDDEAKFIAEKLQAAGVPQARQSLEEALAAMNKSPGGLGEAAVRGVAPGFVAQKVLSDDANAREQAFRLARADLIHALTGAGMPESERKEYFDMMGEASSPAARIRTLEMGLRKLEAAEKNIKAGASREAQDRFDARRQAAAGGPAVAPSRARATWDPK